MLRDQFWVTVNGNFLDICVLEWCKLFADSSGEHYWKEIIADPAAFFNGLMDTLGMTEADFNTYLNEMRRYRDKFVAHLDSDEVMLIPRLEVAQLSVSYLYDYLLAHEDEGNFFTDAPRKASEFYEDFLKAGRVAYKK